MNAVCEPVAVLTGRAKARLIDEIIDRERAELGPGGFGSFEREWLTQRAPEKVRRLLAAAAAQPGLVGAGSTFSGNESGPAAMPASATAVASLAVETNLWNPALWTPIGAGTMRAGMIYSIKGGGILSTTATPTVLWTPRYGQSATPASNISLGASTAVATGSGLANVPWFFELELLIRQLGVAAAGASGTGNGFVVLGGVAAAASQVFAIGGTVAATIDQTIAGGLVLGLTWGTSSASNTCTCQWVTPVRSYN